MSQKRNFLLKYLCIDLWLSPKALLILSRYVSGLQYVKGNIKCQVEVMKGNCLLSDLTFRREDVVINFILQGIKSPKYIFCYEMMHF